MNTNTYILISIINKQEKGLDRWTQDGGREGEEETPSINVNEYTTQSFFKKIKGDSRGSDTSEKKRKKSRNNKKKHQILEKKSFETVYRKSFNKFK